MRSKRPGWAAARRCSSLISALSGRRRFLVDFDEFDETIDAEVGKRHDAVVAETQITPSSGSISKGDVVEPVDVFAAFLCDALYGPDVRDLVDVHGQAARAGMA